MKLTQEELKRLLTYDPDTGIFTNRVSRKRARAGEECGWYSHGYLLASIDSKSYSLHRLAFLYMDGYMPEHFVDHKNGIKDDNRWCNLRHASSICNSQNHKLFITNKSGFVGVCWSSERRKWVAQGNMNDRPIPLGRYTTILDAALARLTWEVNCPGWHCDCRGLLVTQILLEWPQFNLKSTGE